MGLTLKALLCCLRFRSGCESGLASMNPVDFAAASSEPKELDTGNSEVLTLQSCRNDEVESC